MSKMKLSLTATDLERLTNKQLDLYWEGDNDLSPYLPQTLQRLEKCFLALGNKYFCSAEDAVFSHLHAVQYAMYLYYLSNTMHRSRGGNAETATKLYYLNRIMHGVDWYYEIALPDIFGCEHPVGSVMGRAMYSNRFFFYQGCTVGGNGGKYPVLGENVVMYSNSTLLGNSIVGDNVIFATGTVVIDTNIPSNSMVFGKSPNLVIKTKSEDYIKEKTKQFWR